MSRTSGVLVAVAIGVAALGVTAVAWWTSGQDGFAGLVDVAPGVLLLVLAAVTVRETRAYALLSAVTGVLWMSAGMATGVAWLHRPALAWVALSFPDGRLRRGGVLAVAVTATVAVAPLATEARAMAVAGALVAGAGIDWLWRARTWPSTSVRARGRAALWLGLAFTVPLGAFGLARAVVVEPTSVEVAYAGLIAVAVLTLLQAAFGRDHLETEAVIAVAEARDAETTLAELSERTTAVKDAQSRRALDRAVVLLERNVSAQRDLSATVSEYRRSRRRLVNSTVVERRALQRRLSERAVSLLPEIDSLLAEAQPDDPRTRDLLERCRAEVAAIGSDLHVLGEGLHPTLLTEHGLPALATAMATCPVPVTVRLPTRRLPLEVEAALWYACGEAVTNAMKHGRARSVLIEGREGDGIVTVDVRDDGVGGAALRDGGGLAGLADRLAALDGAITVTSSAGLGTNVRITVPVP